MNLKIVKKIKKMFATETNTESQNPVISNEVVLRELLVRGSDHKHFCQDALATIETEQFVYMAVFDGCSDGKDSHFASALFSKVFTDVIGTLTAALDEAGNSLEKNSKFIIFQIARKLNEVRHVLHLNQNEMLSTMVMATINKETREGLVCVFGDGFFSVNGQHTVIQNTRFLNQNEGENKPDYMAYDIHKIQRFADFEEWFSSKSEVYKFENINDITIASDGIGTFRSSEKDVELNDVYDFFAVDKVMVNNKIMLFKKYNILTNRNLQNLMNTDDVSIVRLMFNETK